MGFINSKGSFPRIYLKIFIIVSQTVSILLGEIWIGSWWRRRATATKATPAMCEGRAMCEGSGG